MKFTQIVAQADVPNRNGRIYTKEVLAKMVEDFNSRPAKESLIGQLGFPENNMPAGNVIDLSIASHIVEDLRLKDEHLVADIKILDTNCGEELIELMKNGGAVFRTQGIGKAEISGDTAIISDYTLTTINAVPTEKGA